MFDPTWTSEQLEELLSLWEDGVPYEKIALVIGHSAGSIRNKISYLRKRGKIVGCYRLSGPGEVRFSDHRQPVDSGIPLIPDPDPLLERLRQFHSDRVPA